AGVGGCVEWAVGWGLCGVVVRRVAFDAAGVLADVGLPGAEVGHVQRVEEAEDSAAAIGEVGVFVDRQASRIRCRAVDLDGVVLAGRTAVAARVEEDVVSEAASNGGL